MRTPVCFLVGALVGGLLTALWLVDGPGCDHLTARRFEALLTRRANAGQEVTIWSSTGRVVREDGTRGRVFRIEMEPIDKDAVLLYKFTEDK